MVGFNTFFKKRFNVSFIVRNISNKTINIFNLRIIPSQQADLMSVPEVSEADIKASILKGTLKSKLDANEIEIIFSNIDLNSYDQDIIDYLTGLGITIGVVNEGSTPVPTPTWYPPNNQNDSGLTGVGGGVMAGMIMTIAPSGFRMFGENISSLTEVEVFPTSAASGTTSKLNPPGSGMFGTITVTYTAPTGSGNSFVPGYLLVSTSGILVNGTFWVRARNPGGAWVPYPIQFLTV